MYAHFSNAKLTFVKAPASSKYPFLKASPRTSPSCLSEDQKYSFYVIFVYFLIWFSMGKDYTITVLFPKFLERKLSG